MPKVGPRLVNDYLIPHLDNCSFGNKLKWINRHQKIFSIQFKHKNTANWTKEDAAVYTEWDRLKDPERFQPFQPEYYTYARQRLNSAINKFIKEKILKRIPPPRTGTDDIRSKSESRIYQILKVSKTRKMRKPERPRKQSSAESNEFGSDEEVHINGLEEPFSDIECTPDLQQFSPIPEQLALSDLESFTDLGPLLSHEPGLGVPVLHQRYDMPQQLAMVLLPEPVKSLRELDPSGNELNIILSHSCDKDTCSMMLYPYDGGNDFEMPKNCEPFEIPKEFQHDLLEEDIFYELSSEDEFRPLTEISVCNEYWSPSQSFKLFTIL